MVKINWQILQKYGFDTVDTLTQKENEYTFSDGYVLRTPRLIKYLHELKDEYFLARGIGLMYVVL